jgi:hypothetical protein
MMRRLDLGRVAVAQAIGDRLRASAASPSGAYGPYLTSISYVFLAARHACKRHGRAAVEMMQMAFHEIVHVIVAASPISPF